MLRERLCLALQSTHRRIHPPTDMQAGTVQVIPACWFHAAPRAALPPLAGHMVQNFQAMLNSFCASCRVKSAFSDMLPSHPNTSAPTTRSGQAPGPWNRSCRYSLLWPRLCHDLRWRRGCVMHVRHRCAARSWESDAMRTFPALRMPVHQRWGGRLRRIV